MALQYLRELHSKVKEGLRSDNRLSNILKLVENQTGCQREYIAYGAGIALVVYLVCGHFAQLACNLVGLIYPAYASILAIQTPVKTDDTQWLTYWVIFGMLSVVEFAPDQIGGWFPLYWLCKGLFLVWLYLPSTRGARKIYVNLIIPFMDQYGGSVQTYLEQAKANATATLFDLQEQQEYNHVDSHVIHHHDDEREELAEEAGSGEERAAELPEQIDEEQHDVSKSNNLHDVPHTHSNLLIHNGSPLTVLLKSAEHLVSHEANHLGDLAEDPDDLEHPPTHPPPPPPAD